LDTAENTLESNHAQTPDTAFEDLYIDVRRKEKRVLTDCQLMFLPDIEASNFYYKEWQIRKRSSQKLITYLAKKNKPLKILEIGCGNGWLTSKLAAVPNANVIGLDINQVEINQAKRVFKKQNLEFIGDAFKPGMFKETKFDVILFAASIQYFKSLKDILESALTCLAENGEIHIIDSHFYKPVEVGSAIRRTENYYANLGYPEMAAYYFHHTLNDLKQFNYKVLINPRHVFNKISKKELFYWIVINH
jgi:ubiquinone/menaquinone biosynthesis C-methylase UbiE